MASKEHNRRKRIARSLGVSQRIKDNPHLEHAAAQESRDITAQVVAGTYRSSRQRWTPLHGTLHFSPRNIAGQVLSLPYGDSQGT